MDDLKYTRGLPVSNTIHFGMKGTRRITCQDQQMDSVVFHRAHVHKIASISSLPSFPFRHNVLLWDGGCTGGKNAGQRWNWWQVSHCLTTLVKGSICTDIEYRSSEALHTFQAIARWIPRAISPFLDFHSAMNAAIPTEDPYVFFTTT
jgi:hypothetical protein